MTMTPIYRLLFLLLLPWTAAAMRPGRMAELRRSTVDMFYHGWNNYMEHGFPEDEVRVPLLLSPPALLTRC